MLLFSSPPYPINRVESAFPLFPPPAIPGSPEPLPSLCVFPLGGRHHTQLERFPLVPFAVARLLSPSSARLPAPSALHSGFPLLRLSNLCLLPLLGPAALSSITVTVSPQPVAWMGVIQSSIPHPLLSGYTALSCRVPCACVSADVSLAGL